jgi:putative endonuclease
MPAAERSLDRWFVYLVECRDGSLYCGVAKDVRARVVVHNEGKGAKYTRARLPVKLVAKSRALPKREAFRLEYRVKRLERGRKKSALVKR